MPNEWTIAFWLIVLPVDIPTGTFMDFQALRDVSQLLELYGPTTFWRTDYREEVLLVRQKFWESYDAPRLDDYRRLPNRNVVCAYLEMNEEYTRNLKNRALTRSDLDFYVDMRVAERLKTFWELAYVATNEREYDWVRRRKCMKSMIEIIGPERYYRGEWPSWIPVR